MPFAVSRASTTATVSSGGNRRGGNSSACATASHAAPTTTNGNPVRAAARRRVFTYSVEGDARAGVGTSSCICGRILPAIIGRNKQALPDAPQHVAQWSGAVLIRGPHLRPLGPGSAQQHFVLRCARGT